MSHVEHLLECHRNGEVIANVDITCLCHISIDRIVIDSTAMPIERESLTKLIELITLAGEGIESLNLSSLISYHSIH